MKPKKTHYKGKTKMSALNERALFLLRKEKRERAGIIIASILILVIAIYNYAVQ